MSEIRQNKATGQWVIVAPARTKRPQEVDRADPGAVAARSHADRAERCPFCPGNERMLPGIELEMPRPDSDRWYTRVVPNKFPALTEVQDARRRSEGIYRSMPGHGRHEVIIEGPAHDRDLREMSQDEVAAVIETYHRRYVDLMTREGHLAVLIFRNHGPAAGTSLRHPHSQIVAIGLVPQAIRRREAEATRYFDKSGSCVYCDILEFERMDRRRVILENGSFLAFVPFAAEVPFEIWIMPKRHQADFATITDQEKADLAQIHREALLRLGIALHDPDYNYLFRTPARYQADQPQLHWYLQLRPRITTPAGFEVGSGMTINPSIPEQDAALLRDSTIPPAAAAMG